MTRMLCSGALALLLIVCGAAPAAADLIYDLALRAPGQAASYDQTVFVNPGELIAGVELVLIESRSGGSDSILGDNSVFVGAGGFNERAGNVSSYRANLFASGANGSFANLVANSTGGTTAASDADTTAYLALGGFFGQPGIQATAVGPNVYELVLGTVDLTAPTLGATTFTLADFSDASNFTTFDTGSLELAATASGGSFNSRSLTLSAVPEPSSLALFVLMGGAAAFRRLRPITKQ